MSCAENVSVIKNLCLLVVEWYCSSQVFNLLDNSYFLVKLWKTRGSPLALPYNHIACRDAQTHIRIFMKLVRVVALPSDRAAVWRCPDNRCGRSVWKLPPYHVRGTLYPCPMRTTTECTVYVEHVMSSCAA